MLYVPDVSRWQDVTSLPEAAIVRAHNGYRADDKWAKHAAIATRDCRWWGAYQYLPAKVDAAGAARALAATVGRWRPDVLILDLEEGSGDQGSRQAAWHAAIQWPAEWDYSGAWFTRAHGLTGVEWVAAYSSTEPSIAHALWQFTDKRRFPGIAAPCDASIFHGSIDDLIALTRSHVGPSGGRIPGASAPIPTTTEADMPLSKADLDAIGEVVHQRALTASYGEVNGKPYTAAAVLRDTLNGVRALQASIDPDKIADEVAAKLAGKVGTVSRDDVAAAFREVLGSVDDTPVASSGN